MERRDFDSIVIGAGPAGMMAAGRAAERGRSVLLVEKNDLPGKKLLISGKGRCNITNAGDIDDHLEGFGRRGQFLRNAFSRIFNKELMDFFQDMGVALKTERGKRVFPRSDRSKDILEALKKYIRNGGVTVLLKSEVKNVLIDGSAKKVILASGDQYKAGSVAVCTGGLSYPETGSTGFGFEIAEKLGHKVIDPAPALVPLITKSVLPKTWQGLSLKNIEVTVTCEGKKKAKRFGDLIFTHFGLSGPVILDMSADVVDLLSLKKDVYVSINLKPALSRKEVDERLVREFSRYSNKMVKNVLRELMPQRMIAGFTALCALRAEAKTNQLTKAQRMRLLNALIDLRFKIKGSRPIEEAIVTRGGVDTAQINPKTMESKLIKGLFFAGEVIDVDAKTGGYNMQAAFSTGYLCGDSL